MAVTRRNLFHSAVVAASLSAAVLAQAPAAKSGVITVHEGTDMALTVSPDRKTILIDLQGMIYSLPEAGGKAKQITGGVLEASHPNFSPKGDLVAIQSYSGGTFHIWTMKPDGSDLKQITTGHGDDREPAFSPDGKEIAFSSDRAFKGSYDIWSVELATGKLTQWTSAPEDEYEPAWTPDGKELAYVSGPIVVSEHASAVGKFIYAVDRSGNRRTLADITKANGRLEAPSFSPDGKVSWTQFNGEGIFMDSASLVVGGTTAGKATDAFPFPAVWVSPTELYYTGSGHIYKLNVATKTETEVPFTAEIPWTRPVYKHKDYNFSARGPKPVLGVLAPALSPDGTTIAFGALNQLWTMKIGAKPVQLTHGTAFVEGPQWSPDGKYLAYSADNDGILNLYIRNLATGEEKVVSPDKLHAQILPAWSPDAKQLAFQDETGVTLVVDIATGKTRALTPAFFDPGRPSWSADGKTIAIVAVKPYTHRFREGTNQIALIDVASAKITWHEPAPYESISTRGEAGPVYSPDGKQIAFIMDDLLYAAPTDANGQITGPAKKLSEETADAPTWSGDSSKILFESNGKLRLIAASGGEASAVPFDLTYEDKIPHQKLLIHAGRFWKGEGPDEQKDVDILIVDNRVESVLPHSAGHEKGVDRVVDATKYTVIPGLWENHAHPSCLQSIYYGDRYGRLWLSYGITELRDLADSTYRAEEQREALDSGARIGPRLFPTGEAIDGERVYYSMMIPTTSEAQLNRELERLKAFNFDMVKLYVRLPYAWQVKGSKFAHEQMGVDTGSHYLLPAVDLGNDLMSHISATSRTGYAYSRSFTMNSYADVDKVLSGSGMAVISTTFNQALYAEDPSVASNSRFALYPPWEQDRLKKAVDTAVHTDQHDNLERLAREESTVKKDFDAGGLVLAGTDSPLDVPATSLHLNLRGQVKFGMKPWQALETVTSLPAKAWHVNDLGTLEKGKIADLIIVGGDPLTDIKDAADVHYVMKNGILMSIDEIMAPFAAK